MHITIEISEGVFSLIVIRNVAIFKACIFAYQLNYANFFLFFSFVRKYGKGVLISQIS